MMMAAIGVWLAATISHEALFALGVVLTLFAFASRSYRLLSEAYETAPEHAASPDP